jgi:hypothetical protein
MAEDICDQEEPALLVAEGTAHAAACHFRNRMTDVEAADVFGDDSSQVVTS